MVGRALPEAIEIALRSLFCENMSHTAAACKNIYIHNQSIALLSYTDILWLFFLFVGFPELCVHYIAQNWMLCYTKLWENGKSRKSISYILNTKYMYCILLHFLAPVFCILFEYIYLRGILYFVSKYILMYFCPSLWVYMSVCVCVHIYSTGPYPLHIYSTGSFHPLTPRCILNRNSIRSHMVDISEFKGIKWVSVANIVKV